MSDFQKAINVLRSQGIGVNVKNYEASNIQIATIEGENLSGGIASHTKALLFDDEEIDIIRELLSHMACGYEREDFKWHCCDANEIIAKIDAFRSN